MCENRLRDGNGESTEEEEEEWNPHQILKECIEQFLMPETIFEESVSDSTRPPEHYRGGEEDFEAVHEEPVYWKLEAQQHVIDEGYRYRRCDTV